ncbi:uncharacterized protein LOC121383658 [Gigantopelta aegis]|uniref:uncharacterized protein LOC121383658 n=1 Tax=Gigantopelta aegis TaxID=1735272 RepID=UPI001B887C3D|nr:uncharacterized protein LOC121383658 [Gigantopelta aegis]
MSSSEFKYSAPFEATDEVKAAFDKNGYIIVRGILAPEELNRLKKVLEENKDIESHQWATDDGEGRKSRLTAWLYPGNDVTGMYARSHRMVDTVSKILVQEQLTLPTSDECNDTDML